MNFFRITQTPPPQKAKHRTLRRRNLTYCDCGQPAVSRLTVQVGPGSCYRVVLHLCPACLRLEAGEQ